MPPWLAPFRHAVVRLATYVEGRGTTPRLVFATVELLAPGRPRPVSGSVQQTRCGSPSASRVFFRRVAMGAAEAVAWYSEAARGHLVTPTPSDPAADAPRRDGVSVQAGPLTPEPPWPDLVLPLEADPLLDPAWPGSPAPFVGAGAKPARVSRLLAAPHASLAALVRDEAVSAFLTSRLHVDLSRYPEYLGGMVLVAPDPIARRIQTSLRPRTPERGVREDIVVRILPREGSDLSGLELTLFEVRGGALHQYERLSVPEDGLIVWPRHHEVAMVGHVLTHPIQGVLRHQAPVPFLRRITINPSIASRRVSIRTPTGDSPNAPEETYGVTEHSRDRPLETGPGASASDGLVRIYEAEARRRRLAAAESQGQRWLDDAEAARIHIRRILENASHRVWVADPYLGGRQIFQFIHALSRLSIEIRLITSRLAFEARSDPDDIGAKGGTSDVARLDGFADGLRSLSERGFADVEAWVLRGRSPPLHDRFLVVDDEVWFSGNSLNALGVRAGLIVKVPDPQAVVARLTALRGRAVVFEDYVSERANAVARAGRRSERTPSGEPEPSS